MLRGCGDKVQQLEKLNCFGRYSRMTEGKEQRLIRGWKRKHRVAWISLVRDRKTGLR